MAKDKIADYDGATAGNNTDIGGISIAEGMLPSAVNNSMRELTRQLGAFADGTEGIDVLNLHDDDASASIKLQAPATVTTTTTFTLPDGDGASGYALVTNGSGQLSWASAGGLANVVDDTTPQLGGNLDTNGNDINFGDNDKAVFGAGSDLQIYHDGSNSYIEDTATGSLILKGADVVVKDSSNNDIAKFLNGGAAQLRYAGAIKLATASGGIDVTGTVTADGLTVDGNATINDAFPYILLNESDTTDLNTRLSVGAGYFNLNTLDDAYTVSKQRFRLDNSTGDISFFDSSGVSQSFYWDASTQRLGLGTTSPAVNLESYVEATGAIPTDETIGVTTGNSNVLIGAHNGDNSATFSGIALETRTSGASRWLIANEWKSTFLGDLVFRYRDGGSSSAEAMRITSAGVGIGTASPDGTAHIHTASAGSVTANTDADDLTVENGGNSGISILSPDANRSAIMFGHASDNLKMQIRHDGSTSLSQIISDDALTFNVIGGTERMRINDTGVGIGTTSPTEKLTVNGNIKVNSGVYQSERGTAAAPGYTFGDDTDTGMFNISNADLGFSVGGSEAARIDSSGSLMAGKSATNIANDGFEAHANNYVGITRNASIPLFLNRRTDDGGLIQFRKNNVEVGSIGVDTSRLTIGNGDVGLKFSGDLDNIQPHNTTTNGLRDDAISLGSSVNRFKDAHFSGTVNATSYTGDGSSLTGIAAGATGGGSDEIFWENGQTVTTNYTISNGKNAMSAGPITINTGVTVTVGTGETWTVV